MEFKFPLPSNTCVESAFFLCFLYLIVYASNWSCRCRFYPISTCMPLTMWILHGSKKSVFLFLFLSFFSVFYCFSPLVQTEISQQLLNGFPWNFMNAFTVGRGCNPLTLQIPWLFLWCHHRVKNFMCPILRFLNKFYVKLLTPPSVYAVLCL